jgi:aminopeptidase YwaD
MKPDIDTLTSHAQSYLNRLCLEIHNRRVGSAGNRLATQFFEGTVASFGFATQCPPFDCIDWKDGGASLNIGTETFSALTSPYSLGCRVSLPLAAASTLAELENLEARQKILLVHSELAKEPLMPKNFTFYNPEEHQRIVSALERAQPQAIIAATGRHPELAGGVYPFPLIEDGDFDIPSVYLTEEIGAQLLAHTGEETGLVIHAERFPTQANNVIAARGGAKSRKIVVCAHIDAKDGTPGALDNAAGVVALLLLAETLGDYAGDTGLEIVALNGEDYYSAPGQVQYLSEHRSEFDRILLVINLDACGFRQGKTAYSLYGCPESISTLAEETFASHTEMMPGDAWYQGDHSIFIQLGVPDMAITSQNFAELITHITHTPEDTPGLVDANRLAKIALALKDLICRLD